VGIAAVAADRLADLVKHNLDDLGDFGATEFDFE